MSDVKVGEKKEEEIFEVRSPANETPRGDQLK